MDGDAREVTEGEVAALIGRLALGTPELDDAGRIELIGVLEALKGATAAAQARVSVDFAASQEAQAAAAGVPRDKRGTGVGAQVALARRESPVRGLRHLGLAKALVGEMPATYTALQTGRITEWTATLMVRATACLSVEDRGAVDTRMGHRLGRLSDRATAAAAEALAYELDPEAFVARSRKAVGDRHVTVRPAPDTMAYLTALLPVAEAVGCYAALDKTAKATKSGGDERGLGQLRADTLVARLAGVDPAVGFPVEIQLVMSDATLFAHGAGSGHLPGFGPLPADLARDLAAPVPPDVTTRTPALPGRPRRAPRVRHRARERCGPDPVVRPCASASSADPSTRRTSATCWSSATPWTRWRSTVWSGCPPPSSRSSSVRARQHPSCASRWSRLPWRGNRAS